MSVRSTVVQSPEGWRVKLEAFGRAFLSTPYPDKACATASAEQQPMLLERMVQEERMSGYSSLSDFLDKYVTWLGWEEQMTGDAEQVALTLKVKQETTNSKQLLEQVKAFVIYDQQGIDIAAAILKDVKLRWKAIEADRKKITTPLRQAYENVQALFKEPLDYYASIERILKDKILDAQQRARAAQDAALVIAQAAFQAGDQATTALASHQAQQADISNPQGIQNRKYWRYALIDPQAVPREFWVIDHTALNAYVQLTKGTVKIPGVHVYEDQDLAVRTS